MITAFLGFSFRIIPFCTFWFRPALFFKWRDALCANSDWRWAAPLFRWLKATVDVSSGCLVVETSALLVKISLSFYYCIIKLSFVINLAFIYTCNSNRNTHSYVWINIQINTFLRKPSRSLFFLIPYSFYTTENAVFSSTLVREREAFVKSGLLEKCWKSKIWCRAKHQRIRYKIKLQN